MTTTDTTQQDRGGSQRVVEVATLWNGSVQDVRQLDGSKGGRLFEIGDDPGCDAWVMAESVGGQSRIPLVSFGPSGATAHVPAGALIETRQADASAPGTAERAESARTVAVAPGTVFDITVGETTFRIRQTDAGRIERAATPIDRAAMRWAGISLMAHATFLALVYVVPPEPGSISFDSMVEGNRFVSYLVAPPELPEPTMAELVAEEPTESGVAAAGDAHEGPSGAAGQQDAPERNTRYGIKNRGLDRVQLGRDRMRELAATSGILSVIRSGAPVSPFGADVPNGVDAEDALGHLLGTTVGAAYGNNGLGPAGTGRGGGGVPGGIGMGRLRTIGDRVGGGTGGNCYGCGQSRLLRSRPTPTGPSLSMGVATTSGALAPEVIRRHIRQHRNAIRYCYQRELTSRPDLGGRVAVRFVIGQDGTVVSSGVASSTVESTTVGQCVAQAIGRVSFPPPGQGVVIVTYPFTFIHD